MLDVLWEDDHLLAVAKLSGTTTVPGRDGAESLADYLPAGWRLVHRLDKDTSGVLLLAKDKAAQRHLCRQFLERTVEKEYLALVNGRPATESGHIDAPLAKHPASEKYVIVQKNGRPAQTDWEVAQRFGRLTLLRCFPKTGRTHQLRVHLKSIGHPLAIDPLYGRSGGILLSRFKHDYKQKTTEEKPLINRLTLHALRITFKDMENRPVTVICPPPRDFRATIKMLGKYAGN